MKVRLTVILVLACALALQAATVRLYLKDGTYHAVREYKTEGDRVRYYSTERGDWEEIPVDLVDLKKTEDEIKRRADERKEDAKMQDAEDAAERALREEQERIPYEPGAFITEGETVTALKQAEAKIVNNKRRSILKALSPIPMISGKATVELEGTGSAFVLRKPRPEFYFRPTGEERFAIARVTPGKTTRIVQKWDIVPVSKEIVETTDIVETFKQQLNPGLYKIWATKDMVPGEYAVIEYTEGSGNIKIWDFAIQP